RNLAGNRSEPPGNRKVSRPVRNVRGRHCYKTLLDGHWSGFRKRRGIVNKLVALALVIGIFAPPSLLFAQDAPGPLTRAESIAYHACLRAAWVDDYCRSRSFGFLSSSYDTCLISNGVQVVPVRGYGIWAKDRCWALARVGVVAK